MENFFKYNNVEFVKLVSISGKNGYMMGTQASIGLKWMKISKAKYEKNYKLWINSQKNLKKNK